VRFRVAALRFPDEPTQASVQALDDPVGDEGAEDAPPPLGSAGNPFAPMIIEVCVVRTLRSRAGSLAQHER
jgi:hypothetical protein